MSTSCTPNITFVCCVESGWLEAQTVRLVESLQRFGGRFANASIIAVTPRFGPPLSRTTRATLRAHNVQHLRRNTRDRYTWFNFFNKPLALLAAEPYIRTESIGWVDSDLLIVNEPEQLELTPTEEFLAFPSEDKEMGTTGPDDPFEGLWQACCNIVGVKLEELPWVTTAQTHQRIRLYFNGGLFVYRRGCGFAAEYLRLTRALLDSRVSTRAQGYALGFNEMVSVALAVVTLGLNWRPLPYSHNYPMLSQTHKHWYRLEALKDARIVHWHDSMWPPFWSTFLTCMREAHPEVAAWLASIGPMRVTAPPHFRLYSRCLRALRSLQAERYSASCTHY